MIDIKILRENPEIVRDSQRRRGEDEKIVDEIILRDERWRELVKEIQQLRHQRNLKSIEVGKLYKSGKREEAEKIKEEVKILNEKIKSLEEEADKLKEERDKLLMKLPNIVHPEVPVGFSEEENRPLRFWGKAKVQRKHLDEFLDQSAGKMEYEVINWEPKSHVDLLPSLNLVDLERAAKISGARFFFMKKDLVFLELALIKFALDFLVEKGYIPIAPPYMIRRKAMEGAEDLSLFEEMLYKVEGEDLFLIATSEHPLVAMYMNEILEPKQLPIKLAGISPCFRKEAGAHGKDTKGIFRVHQFNKVEQIIFCRPEESWNYLEEVISNAEEIYRKLGIPYRVVDVCTGELGGKAARKYDLEAWFPVQGKFREVVSASNCTDYQARRLMIRYRVPDGFRYVHIINSTAIAVQRTIVAIVENYQREDGRIEVPEVLRKYTGFDVIPS